MKTCNSNTFLHEGFSNKTLCNSDNNNNSNKLKPYLKYGALLISIIMLIGLLYVINKK